MSTQIQYPYSAYDTNLCLKMSAGMWAALAFLLRPYVIVAVSLADRTDRMGVINTFYPDKASMGVSALLAIPAMLLVFAWLKRQQAQGGAARWIWHKGKAFLLAITVLNLVVITAPSVVTGHHLDPAALFQALACGLIIWYLLRSRRVSDTFRDYP